MNVLIVSASMGAGHDGAARELKRRLEDEGHIATTRDFLNAVPARGGRLVRASYEWQLKVVPWSYEATYRSLLAVPVTTVPLASIIGMLTSWRLRRWVAATKADVVVSTYPLASLALGRMRKQGRLGVPVVTFITDFAVHPLWTHPGVDLHLGVHPQVAATAMARTGTRAAAPGPLVPQGFISARVGRQAARERLGLPDDEQIVLLVAGSWGVGDIEQTFDDVAGAGRYVPLAVCGHNERLRRRLAAKDVGIVFGWTDEMPVLMAAADALVENAGGLTCMEAFASGLPVVTYRPIAGHGRGNAEDMARAGVATYVACSEGLADGLARAVGEEGRTRAVSAQSMFVGDAASEVASEVARARDVLVSMEAHPVTVGRARRRLSQAIAVAAAAAALLYSVAVFGVGTAAAHGLAVARAPHHAVAAYVGARLNGVQLADPAVQQVLAVDQVTAIVSGRTATDEPGAVARLAAAGVEIANGGWGGRGGFRWSRAHTDVVRSGRAIGAAANERIRLFVPARPVDGFDLASAQLADERIVVATDTDGVALATVPPLRARGIYVIDARSLPDAELLAVLAQLGTAAAASDLEVMPLDALS